MTTPEPDDGELTALVAAALDRLEQGGTAALDALCAEHPALADRIRSRVLSLHRLGLLEGAPAAPAAGAPARLGDFRLLEPLGSGGMGMVYRAHQTSLDREVAVKVLRPEQLLFPGARERFEREVQAVARLQHESIVAVHSVGTDGDVPYFAMERVAGANLADVIAALAGRRPQELSGADLLRTVHALCGTAARDSAPPRLFEGSWVRACFRIAFRLADALVHAHAEGVLHRDLKPSNVMLTPAGRVVLMDFGLAGIRGADRLTRSGAVLGSLPYMAPEQLRGDSAAVDERTDVYALGVTLYELTCLRLPFGGDDPEHVRAAILRGGAPPLSRRNSTVAWDGETICLTAMDPDPARRYASASELRADLRSYLDLRPIRARRPGPVLRTRRFAQRHPALATAAVVATIAAVGAAAVLIRNEQLARQRIAQADRARDQALERAQANLGWAAEVIEQTLGRLAAPELAHRPGLDRFAMAVLEDAAGFLDRLAAANDQGPPELRLRLARSLQQAATLRQALGGIL